MRIIIYGIVFALSFLVLTSVTFGEFSNEDQYFFKVGDFFSWQNLQTGEIIPVSGTLTVILVSSLGPILIVLFIVIYATKKRKKSVKEKK